MKDKYKVVPQTTAASKPAKANVSEAEFRSKLKNITEWRKKRLVRLHPTSSR